jgi:hypothetical protein
MKPNDRVMQLCAQIQDEQNHTKLTKLLDELCELLDQAEQERQRMSCVVIKAKAS